MNVVDPSKDKAKVQEALEKSIEKWRKLASVGSCDENISSTTCPLCHLFLYEFNKNRSVQDDCIGCPVQQRVQALGCNNSPWKAVLGAKLYGTTEEFRAAAADELAFLESLRTDVLADTDKESAT